MRLLDRPRPDVDVALLVEAAVEGEGLRLRPGPHHQLVRFQVALAQQAGVLAEGVTGVHRRADRKPRDQPPAGDAVEHGEFLGDPGRRVVQRQRIAHHADRRVRRAARYRRGDQIGRGHQAVAVGVMLVAAHRVEAAVGGELHLVHEVVVHQVRALRVEQRGMDVDPDRSVLLGEVVRQLGVRHQVEPQQFHGRSPFDVADSFTRASDSVQLAPADGAAIGAKQRAATDFAPVPPGAKPSRGRAIGTFSTEFVMIHHDNTNENSK